jgi:hypothetical protein
MSEEKFAQIVKYYGKTVLYTFPKQTDPDEIYYLEDSFERCTHFGPYVKECYQLPKWKKGTFEYHFELIDEFIYGDEDESDISIETIIKNLNDNLKNLKTAYKNSTDDFKCLKRCGFNVKALDHTDKSKLRRNINDPKTLFCRVHLDADPNKYTVDDYMNQMTRSKKQAYLEFLDFIKNPVPKQFEVSSNNDDNDIVFTYKKIVGDNVDYDYDPY